MHTLVEGIFVTTVNCEELLLLRLAIITSPYYLPVRTTVVYEHCYNL